MRDLDPHSTLENVESYGETLPGFGSCDDEFVGILTLATEQGSTIDILTELLEDLIAYEQRYEMEPDEFLQQVGQEEDILDVDFLLWSRTYYRFIALSSLVKGR